MKRIGITGQSGFIGYHLYHHLKRIETVEVIEFEDDYFDDDGVLDEFVSSCDTVIHLAAVNRHDDQKQLYDINVKLAEKLVNGFRRSESKASIIFSSSTQESLENYYGKSKQKSREILTNWAEENQSDFAGLIIPNVFGPFSKPFHNTFIATFAALIIKGEKPTIIEDNNVELIYVTDLVSKIYEITNSINGIETIELEPSYSIKVSDVLKEFNSFHSNYILNGQIPNVSDKMIRELFLTFTSFIDLDKFHPRKLIQHKDERGFFAEIVKVECAGQTSFSTTKPGITRGNHYHTRKYERFTVINGNAIIELRQIGTDTVFSFKLDGANPSYVDMPVHFTHNITNTGETDLITVFWINEPYDEQDPDTFFEKV